MEKTLSIKSFQKGINESLAEGLLKEHDALYAHNCDIASGSLKAFPRPSFAMPVYPVNPIVGMIHTIIPNYNTDFDVDSFYLFAGGYAYNRLGQPVLQTNLSGRTLDFVNFQVEDKQVPIVTSREDATCILESVPPTPDGYYNHTTLKQVKLLNRRKVFNKDGTIKEYVDNNGKIHASESTITTYAPKGDFIELHYDRLWIAGEKTNPDRVYFSTANVNGADVNDWTVPTEEGEANQHGGFLDVRSYDGGKIIGLKVVFNSVVIFKETTAFKIFGNAPDNYQLVQLFSCSGAIANKSIVVGNNGAYFLNNDGIYYFDGTNVNLISQKIQSVIKKLNFTYARKAVGCMYDNKYYLSIPTTNSDYNTILIVYDTITQSFMTYDLKKVQHMCIMNNELIVAQDNNYMYIGTGDNCYDLKWVTPKVDFEAKNCRKMSTYIYFRGRVFDPGGTDVTTENKVKITLTTERTTKVIEVALDKEEKLYRKKLKGKGRFMQLTFENINGSPIEIIAPELIVELDED